MYKLAKEVKLLEKYFLCINFNKPENWLYDDENLQEFFSAWRQLIQHYQTSHDMFIHPLVIFMYKQFIVETTTLIEDKNTTDESVHLAQKYRTTVNAYFDIILEETTHYANESLVKK